MAKTPERWFAVMVEGEFQFQENINGTSYRILKNGESIRDSSNFENLFNAWEKILDEVRGEILREGILGELEQIASELADIEELQFIMEEQTPPSDDTIAIPLGAPETISPPVENRPETKEEETPIAVTPRNADAVKREESPESDIGSMENINIHARAWAASSPITRSLSGRRLSLGLCRADTLSTSKLSTEYTKAWVYLKNNELKLAEKMLIPMADNIKIHVNDEGSFLHALANVQTDNFTWLRKMVHDLIGANVNVNAVDRNGDTCLHVAAQKNNLMCAKLLSLNSVDWSIKNKKGETAEDIARALGYQKMECILIQAHEWTKVHIDTVEEYKKIVKAIEENAEFETIYRLLVPASDGCKELVTSNGSILHLISNCENQIMILKIVKECQSTINRKNADGNTPLHIAVMARNTKYMRTLMLMGADKDIKNKKNQMPHQLIDRELLAEDPSVLRVLNNSAQQVDTKPSKPIDVTLSVEEQEKLVEYLKSSNSLEIKDRKRVFSTFENSFLGKDAVACIQKFRACSKEEAMSIGTALIKEGDVIPLGRSHTMKDNETLYRFKDDQILMESFRKRADAVVLNRAQVGIDVSRSLKFINKTAIQPGSGEQNSVLTKQSTLNQLVLVNKERQFASLLRNTKWEYVPDDPQTQNTQPTPARIPIKQLKKIQKQILNEIVTLSTAEVDLLILIIQDAQHDLKLRKQSAIDLCKLAWPNEMMPGLREKLRSAIIFPFLLDLAIEGQLPKVLLRRICKKDILIVSTIARGASGIVYHVNYENELCVAKFVSPELSINFHADEFWTEATIMTVISDWQDPLFPLLPCIGCGEASNSELFLLMPAFEYSLHELLSSPHKIPKTTLIDIAYQIARGISLLHHRGIMHRDLKSGNILVRRMNNPPGFYHCVVADFGTARSSKLNNRMTLNIGTMQYTAPEVFCQTTYDKSVDVYSFGIILYEMFCSTLIYENTSNLVVRVCGGERPPIPKQTPSCLSALIESCWDHAPQARPPIDMVMRWLDGLKTQMVPKLQVTSFNSNELPPPQRRITPQKSSESIVDFWQNSLN